MIVYNYDADLEVSDTCVRSSLLSWVELSIVSARNTPQCTQLKAILCRTSTKNSYVMHTIKITPNLLLEYQCTSGKFIRLPNRIEKIYSAVKIESNRNFFCPNWNALLHNRWLRIYAWRFFCDSRASCYSYFKVQSSERYIFVVKCGRICCCTSITFSNTIMSEDTVNRTNETDDINATIAETKNASLPETIIEKSIFASDSAALISILIAVAAVLVTAGKWTYGLANSV